LVADAGLQEESRGYSVGILMTPANPKPDPGLKLPTGTISYASAGVMIGSQNPEMQFPQDTRFAPYVILRNTSRQNLSLTLKANYSKGLVPSEVLLQNVMLPAGKVQRLDMTNLLAKAGLSNLNGYINLATAFQGGVRDLLIATGSVDQTGTYVFAVEPVVEQTTKSKVVCYWNTFGDTDTMLTLWSFSKQDQDLTLRLFYRQSHYDLPVHLTASASTMMSFASIIREQKPDASGQVIPSNVTEGSAVLLSARDLLDDIYVASAESEFNVRTATCSGNCASCVGVESFWFDPNPDTIGVGAHQMMDVTVLMTSGGGGHVGSLSTWSSNNTSIATVSNTSPNVGMNTGMAMGSTSLYFFYEDAPGGPPYCNQYCQIVEIYGTPPVSVFPTITGQNTVWYFGGQTPSGYATSIVLTSNAGGNTTWAVTAGRPR
jgi:hypothetical protein